MVPGCLQGIQNWQGLPNSLDPQALQLRDKGIEEMGVRGSRYLVGWRRSAEVFGDGFPVEPGLASNLGHPIPAVGEGAPEPTPAAVPTHDNVRGAAYYQ